MLLQTNRTNDGMKEYMAKTILIHKTETLEMFIGITIGKATGQRVWRI